jgi:hypothetical protein
MPKPTQTTMAERSFPIHPSPPHHHHHHHSNENDTSRHRDSNLSQLPLNPNDYWLEHYERNTPPTRPKPKQPPSLAPYSSKWKSKYPNPKTRDGLLAKLSKLFENDQHKQNYYGGYPMGGMGMGGMGMGGMGYGGMGMGGMGMGGMYPGMMGGMGMGGMYPGMMGGMGMGGMGGYGVSPLCPYMNIS